MKNTDIKNTLVKMFSKIKSVSKRTMVIAVAAALIISAAGVGTYAFMSNSKSSVVSSETVYAADDETSATKDETVYVIADADGNVEKVIVSDWLKNSSGNKNVADITTLEDIENVNGDEGYTIDSDNSYVWDADGEDIYYQGISQGDLPVDVKLSYSLDGKAMSAKEIAGKSGKVTIRFDYTNNQKQTVSIDGKDEDIYVPFTVITGTILDDETFTNIEVSNGKIINDGSRSIVVGFALPGMQESLNLNSESLELPEYIEITADVKNFELTTTLTMVSNDLFNQVSDEASEKENNSSFSLEQLSSGINQLVDGSSTLYDGTSQLLNKSGALIAGINQLAQGAEQVSGGVDTVRQTLKMLCSNNADLQSGANQVFTTLLSTTQQQLQAAGLDCPTLTKDNYASVLGGISSNLSEENIRATANAAALKEVTQQVEQNDATIRQGVTNSVEENVRTGVLANNSMTADDYANASEEQKAAIDSAVEQQMQSSDIQAAIENGVNTQKQQLIDSQMNSQAVQNQINAAVDANLPKAKDAQKSISAAIAQLDAYNEFYQGLCQYTNGVQSLYDGTADLQTGASALNEGLNEVNDNTGALENGITQLNDGAMQLSDGMAQFKAKGLEKLMSAANGDISELTVRFNALRDISAAYNSYSGISDDADGSVKFVYRTDSITDTEDK